MFHKFSKGKAIAIGGDGTGWSIDSPFYWYRHTDGWKITGLDNSNSPESYNRRIYIRVYLNAGTNYQIGTSSDFDGKIWLYNTDGSEITSADDSSHEVNGEYFSDIIDYTPSTSGVYIIGAGAYSDGSGPMQVCCYPQPEVEKIPESTTVYETSSGFNAMGKPIGYRSASGAGVNYNPILVKAGLVFYAPLEKDIAPIIGNTPSLSGVAIFGEVNGVKCLQCNGNTRIDYPQTDDLPTGNAPRTMSAWISSSYSRGNWDFACGFGGDDNYTMSYCFNGQRLRLYRRDMNVSYTFINGYPYDNTWVHCLTTFDGTTVKTYANGVLTFYFNVSYATSNRSVYLGYLGTQNAFNYYGNIASFRIYNRALTEDEIKTLANEFK